MSLPERTRARAECSASGPFADTGWLWQRALVWCGIVGPVVVFVIAVIAAARTPAYNPIADTISDLAAQGAPRPLLMRVGLIVFGSLTIAFATGLPATMAARARLMRVFLSAFGVCVVLLGIFQDYSEAPGAPRNSEGFLHNTFGLISIASLLGAMLVLALITRADTRWRPLAESNYILSLIVLIAAVMFSWGPTRFEGLAELVLFSAALAWMGMVTRHALNVQWDRAGSTHRRTTGRQIGTDAQDMATRAPFPGDG